LGSQNKRALHRRDVVVVHSVQRLPPIKKARGETRNPKMDSALEARETAF